MSYGKHNLHGVVYIFVQYTIVLPKKLTMCTKLHVTSCMTIYANTYYNLPGMSCFVCRH